LKVIGKNVCLQAKGFFGLSKDLSRPQKQQKLQDFLIKTITKQA
jgi:hypothetical protein